MFCLSFRTLDSLQYRALAIGANVRYGSYWKTIKQIEVPYRILPVLAPQISQEQYLRTVQDIVHRLKIAGAKVVIVPLPDFFELSPHGIKIIQEIAADSIVVFGVHGAHNPFAREQESWIEDKNDWWAKHPFFNHLKVPWGVMSPVAKEYSPLIRFVPVGFRENETGEPVSDVAIIALKRYLGVPDGDALPLSLSRLLVGPLVIQIGQDGVSSLRVAYTLRRQTEISGALNAGADSLDYSTAWDEARRATITPEEAWHNHKGCIVMIDWDGARRSQNVYYSGAYLQIFGSAFNGSFLTVHNEWNVLLITTLVVVLSVFSYTFRNSLTVLISVVLVVGAVLISGWLFVRYNVLFEPIYIIVPIVLSGLILPLVKISGEKRLLEDKIKSLEEENQRLLDLQRSTPPRALP